MSCFNRADGVEAGGNIITATRTLLPLLQQPPQLTSIHHAAAKKLFPTPETYPRWFSEQLLASSELYRANQVALGTFYIVDKAAKLI
mmetsp:Transcript_1326/g.1382  ORF Transcript_1326/g.1382 Transcript_1326/m.1382 type:complete len:87 (-) Transcript_1326:1482-1742(-)